MHYYNIVADTGIKQKLTDNWIIRFSIYKTCFLLLVLSQCTGLHVCLGKFNWSIVN